MSNDLCVLCSQNRVAPNGKVLEKVNALIRTLNDSTLPMKENARDRLSSAIEERFGSDPFILRNKIAYLSLKGVEKRKKVIALVKKIEKQKIQIAELAIEKQRKLSILRSLESQMKNKEQQLSSHQAIYDSLSLNNKFLSEMLFAARWRAVLGIFLQFKVTVDCFPPPSLHNHSEMKLAGCSTILDLPLPNTCDFRGVPPEIASSALAHVAHCVDSLAAVLNVRLPHPIRPFDTLHAALISPHGDLMRHVALTPCFQTHQEDQHNMKTPEVQGKNGAAELVSLLGQPRRNSKTKKLMTATSRLNTHEPVAGSSGDGIAIVDEAIASRFGVSATGVDGESKWSHNAEFSFGLSLLQADVLTLCVKAGVGLRPRDLFPPQAVLLNISLLYTRCLDVISGRLVVHGADGGSSGSGVRETDQVQQHQESFRRWFLLATELRKVGHRAESGSAASDRENQFEASQLVSHRDVNLFRHRYEKRNLSGRQNMLDIDDSGDDEVVDLIDGEAYDLENRERMPSQMPGMPGITKLPSNTTSLGNHFKWDGSVGKDLRKSSVVESKIDDADWSIVENEFL